MEPSHTDARARSMWNWFCLAWLVLVLGVTAILAVGGQPDPPGKWRALDGPWRFRAGDDPSWADPKTDDRSWDRITLVSRPNSRDGDVGIPGYLDGWRARGHPGLEGYGWYRRQVSLPRQGDLVLLGPPSVDDGYEMYWNGHRVGGVGRLSGVPKVNATRPLLVRLPVPHGEQNALLAIRAFMQPGIGRDERSGGLRTVPVLASGTDGAELYRAQWRRTIAGYVVDAAEPAAMFGLAIIAALMAPALARPGFARWTALALVASACLRLGNAISAWTSLLSLPVLLWQNGVILAPLAKLAWAVAWNQWADGQSRRAVSIGAVVGAMVLVAGALADAPILDGAGRAVIALCLAATAIRIAHHREQKLLALTAMALTAVGLFAGDLSALGVPGIWFPFQIGVSRSQYAWALALPLLAFALAAKSGARTGGPSISH